MSGASSGPGPAPDVPVTRVAVVTGAARGIGAATVRRLVAAGCHVAALDWCAGDDPAAASLVPYAQPTRAELDAVAAEHPGRVLALVVDVRDREALAGAVAEVVARWGRLDVAVAAAAVLLGGAPLWETPPEQIDLLWDVDARGVWQTAAACVPAMLSGPAPAGCRFVAVASAAAHTGLFGLAAYNATKHAVVGLVRGLAADLVGTGVTAVAVSPGSTRTGMLEATAAVYGLDGPEGFADTQLLRRLLEADEIAATVAFCCSLEGAVLNGGEVRADGGFPG